MSLPKIKKENYWELAVFLIDYHSGQWSRGYRLLCLLMPQGFSSSFCEEMRNTEIYEYLVANYRDSV